MLSENVQQVCQVFYESVKGSSFVYDKTLNINMHKLDKKFCKKQ
jgi:hypothetical protein